MTYVVAFFAYFVLDMIWARYTLSVTNKHRWKAAGYAVLINAFAGISVIIYVADPYALIATSFGAFLGTLVAIPRSDSGPD